MPCDRDGADCTFSQDLKIVLAQRIYIYFIFDLGLWLVEGVELGLWLVEGVELGLWLVEGV